MRILGVRGYKMTPYGKQAAGEAALASKSQMHSLKYSTESLTKRSRFDAHFEALENEDLCEVRAIVATQPAGRYSFKVPEPWKLG